MAKVSVETLLKGWDEGLFVTRTGELRIRCPFRELHADGSGRMSMFVNPDKNVYNCFSCHSRGKLTSLLTTRFKVSLFDAVEMVSIDGVSGLPTYEHRTVETHGSAWEWPHPVSSEPPKEFLDRDFSAATLREFLVGSADLEERNVLCIPMVDKARRVYGLLYREETPSRRFWYSEGFQREKFLYNGHDGAISIVVEGPTDAWRAWQNGTRNVEATLGTEVSARQVKLLGKKERIILAYDSDSPGTLAAEYLYLMLRSQTDVLFAVFEAEDPGACKKEDWLYATKNPMSYGEYSVAMHECHGDAYENITRAAREKVLKVRL